MEIPKNDSWTMKLRYSVLKSREQPKMTEMTEDAPFPSASLFYEKLQKEPAKFLSDPSRSPLEEERQ